MFEVKRPSGNKAAPWHSPFSYVVPTVNITPAEQKKLDERERILDLVEAASEEGYWVKINSGIYKGTIFHVDANNDRRWNSSLCVEKISRTDLWAFTRDLDPTKKFQFVTRQLRMYNSALQKPIRIGDNTVFTEFMGRDIENSASILLDYDGDAVFHLDETKRPPTFTDRLGQEVAVGDLVVVALNYGEGLEVCLIKGYSDERRVVIEKVESGDLDRIPLENNATRKIMRMPNTLKDVALMMKLARVN